MIAFITATSACGSTTPFPANTQFATPQSTVATQKSPLPEPIPSVFEGAPVEATVVVEQTISVPSGLEVVYLHDGNLWIWKGAGDNVKLTGTGDISTVRLSGDGQLLAFVRGREVWTIRMDGTDARLHVTQRDEGGALWFAPNGSLLTVSTADHIDVIDLPNATTTTIVAYPAIPDGYYPQVVWSSDLTGFKTVMPPDLETSQAELLFVLANGTKASLAKFSMVPTSESSPFISPDGGYVIYVAKLSDGKESLYLMDSSGATRPYGESGENIRTYGWLPDSKHFAYAVDNQKRLLIGAVMGDSPVETDVTGYETIRWVDDVHFLAVQENSFYLADTNGGRTLIAEGVSGFDVGK